MTVHASYVTFGMFLIPVYMQLGVLVMPLTCRLLSFFYRIDLWTMSITTLVVIFSAPMPKSSGAVA